MKNSILTVTLLTGLFSLKAFAGGDATGGGDTIVPLSSAKEVSQAIDEARVNFRNAFIKTEDSGMFGSTICNMGREPWGKRVGHSTRLLEILDDITKECSFDTPLGSFTLSLKRFEKMVDQTAIVKLPKGACRTADGAHKEAAVVRPSDPNSPICFSIARLQRVPKELLPAQILGLMAHEFTHKFGYGEVDAVLVQKYFVSEIAGHRTKVRNRIEANISYLRSDVDKLLSTPKERRERCADLRRFLSWSEMIIEFGYMTVAMNLYNAPEAARNDFVQQMLKFKPTILRQFGTQIWSYCEGQSSDQEIDATLKDLKVALEKAAALVPAVIPMNYK